MATIVTLTSNSKRMTVLYLIHKNNRFYYFVLCMLWMGGIMYVVDRRYCVCCGWEVLCMLWMGGIMYVVDRRYYVCCVWEVLCMLWMGGIVYHSHRDNLIVLNLHNIMEGSIQGFSQDFETISHFCGTDFCFKL